LKRILLIWLLCIVCISVYGQNYYNISHPSGSMTIGSIVVNVAKIGSSSLYPGGGTCGAGPYHVGAGPVSPVTSSGFTYTFSRAVKEVRFQITASEPGEIVSVKVNGINYMLTTANLGTFTGFCGTWGGVAINTSGQMYFTAGGNINTQLRIQDSIKSITLTDVDTVGGSVMSVDFVTDTVVEVINYVDTLLCVGDTIDIPYRIAGNFSPANQFIFQLSDQYGSFASPTILGSVNSMYSGTYTAVIPTVPVSDAYKIRVVATSPAYISKPFPVNIAIGQIPFGVIYNTGPACAGNFAQIGYTNYTHFTEVRWSRWGGAVFSKLQHHPFPHVQFSDSGLYVAEMHDYGCMIWDTTRLRIKPNPLLVSAINNSPVCEGDTLSLRANIDSANAVNVWLKPDGNTDTLKNIVIANVAKTDTGRYVLITRLDGCLGFDTLDVVVKHKPVTALEDISICFGETLYLQAKDTVSGISYLWNGPSGFAATVRDATISQAYFNRKGMYTLTASLNGCVTTDTLQADIKPLPVTPVALKDTTLCSGATILLGCKEKIPGTDYGWTGPASFAAGGVDTFISKAPMTASGQYILTAFLNGCLAADTIDVLVKRTPLKPEVSSNSPLLKGGTLQLRIDNKESGINYSWIGPAGFATSILAPDIKDAQSWQSGKYTLIAELDGCIDSSFVLVNIGDVADTGMIVLYPNANNGDFFLKGLLHKDQMAELKITNDVGQMVYRASAQVTDKMLFCKVPLRGTLASGVYMLKLFVDGDYKVFKFVVKRD